MIRIVPTTLDELDELLVYQRSEDALPEIFYRYGFQIIHPDTGRPCAGGEQSNSVHHAGPGHPIMGAGGGGGSGSAKVHRGGPGT